jgi:hypothetical protein
LLDGLAGTEDVYFYLFLADSQYLCYFLVTLAFEVAQLHDASLFLGQDIDEVAYQLDLIALFGLFLRVRRVAPVWRVVLIV